jgi:hypothetical protein
MVNISLVELSLRIIELGFSLMLFRGCWWVSIKLYIAVSKFAPFAT